MASISGVFENFALRFVQNCISAEKRAVENFKGRKLRGTSHWIKEDKEWLRAITLELSDQAKKEKISGRKAAQIIQEFETNLEFSTPPSKLIVIN